MNNKDKVIQSDDFQQKKPDSEKNFNKQEQGQSNLEGTDRKNLLEGFDKDVVGRAGREIHGAENIEDFIKALRRHGEVVFANGKKIDGGKVAGVVENVTRDIMSGKLEFGEGLVFITRTFKLRDDFEKLIQAEIVKNEKVASDIDKVNSFADLYSILEKAGNIYSTNNELSPDKWVGAIEGVREEVVAMNLDVKKRPSVLQSITNNLGIRDKVSQLLTMEK